MKKRMLITVCLLLFLYFCYKGFNLYIYNISRYTSDYKKTADKFKIGNQIKIIKKTTPDSYIENNGIKIRNDFDKFVKIENSDNEYNTYRLSENTSVSFIIGNTKNNYLKLIPESINDMLGSLKSFSHINTQKIYDKYDIKNDIDLFKTAYKFKNKKVSIFTSVNMMKEYFLFQNCLLNVPLGDRGIQIITGDYQGYVFTSGNVAEYVFLKNNKRYVVSFMGLNYFTQQYIDDLLSTITIE